MKWSDISLKKFYEIQDILSVEDDYTILNLIDCVYGVDCQSMPINKLKDFDILFIKEPIPEVKLKNKYTINGTVYNSNYNLTKVTVAQFIDYQNYIKNKPVKYEDILSIFFIPENCDTYNTNYDIEKVKSDLLELPIDVVHSICFFFNRQLRIFFKIFQFSLINQVKKIEKNKQKKKQLISNIKQMDLWGLVSSLTYLNTAKSQTKQ